MAWTTWIEIEAEDTANEVVQQLYQRTRDRATGSPPDAVRLTSLTPQVAGLLYDLQQAIYHGAKGLSLREKEIAALIVSVYNGCVH
jgi:alkylhydroperoxidase family enzyme